MSRVRWKVTATVTDGSSRRDVSFTVQTQAREQSLAEERFMRTVNELGYTVVGDVSAKLLTE